MKWTALNRIYNGIAVAVSNIYELMLYEKYQSMIISIKCHTDPIAY